MVIFSTTMVPTIYWTGLPSIEYILLRTYKDFKIQLLCGDHTEMSCAYCIPHYSDIHYGHILPSMFCWMSLSKVYWLVFAYRQGWHHICLTYNGHGHWQKWATHPPLSKMST